VKRLLIYRLFARALPKKYDRRKTTCTKPISLEKLAADDYPIRLPGRLLDRGLEKCLIYRYLCFTGYQTVLQDTEGNNLLEWQPVLMVDQTDL